MSRYLFSTITAAAALATCAGPSACFASNGAEEGAGGGKPPKPKAAAKAEAQPAAAAAAPAVAEEGAGGGAAAQPDASTPTGAAGDDSINGGSATDAVAAAADAKAEPEAPSLAEPASLGFAKISHPGGATSVSHGGQVYEADKNGNITVPLAAVDDLTSHGFALVG